MKKLLTIIGTVFLISCYYDNEEELYPESTSNCVTLEISYVKDIEPIISSSCATPGCHVSGGTGLGNFEIFEELKSKVDNNSFQNRVFIQKNMPPDKLLSSCEIKKLESWIAQGALNN